MSQLVGLITQMYGNEALTDIIYRTDVRTTERWSCRLTVDILCSVHPDATYCIFTAYDSALSITSMIQKRLDEL